VAVLCLHLVHIPYWFDGILHWHYVFETAPLLLMLTAVGLADSCHTLRFWVSQRMAVAWVSLLVGVGLLPGWIALPEFGDISKVQAATEEQAFSRSHLAFFDRTMAADFVQRPALVLVDERGADPQLSYIINGPELDAEVIVCRRPDTDREIEELREAFPDRVFYEFDPEKLQFSSLPETSATE
jgi:hypothetical protein